MSLKIKMYQILFLFLDSSVINNWINHIDTNEKTHNYFEYGQ